MKTVHQIVSKHMPHLTGMKKVRAIKHLSDMKKRKQQRGHVAGKTKRGAIHKRNPATMSTADFLATANMVNDYA